MVNTALYLRCLLASIAYYEIHQLYFYKPNEHDNGLNKLGL
jgi:hypothetical protein